MRKIAIEITHDFKEEKLVKALLAANKIYSLLEEENCEKELKEIKILISFDPLKGVTYLEFQFNWNFFDPENLREDFKISAKIYDKQEKIELSVSSLPEEKAEILIANSQAEMIKGLLQGIRLGIRIYRSQLRDLLTRLRELEKILLFNY